MSNSTFTDNVAGAFGGGIYSLLGNVEIENVIFTSNTAMTDNGGGFYSIIGSVIIRDSLFSLNTASTGGGAYISISGANKMAQLDNITFDHNDATNQDGGALYVGGSGHLSIRNSIISNNTAGDDGGGLYRGGGTTSIEKTRIQSNISAGDGGGLICTTSTCTISETTIDGNTTTSSLRGGGGIYTQSSTVQIDASAITNNTATRNSGGGIRALNGNIFILNSTLSGNATMGGTKDGGGIYNQSANTTFINSTIYGNTATDDGGGIFRASGSIKLLNTIVSGNNANDQGDEIYGAVTADGNNLLGYSGRNNAQAFANGFTPGASDITATSNGLNPTAIFDILDTTLANNGGTTLSHALVANSPAIDAGDDALATDDGTLTGNTLFTDQRLYSRFAFAAVDIGAVEVVDPMASHEVLVTVTGLNGGLVLQNNGADNLAFNVDGTQAFSMPVANTVDFLVTVLNQPTVPNQNCVVLNGSGTINNAGVMVSVNCTYLQYIVGVNVSGLAQGNSIEFDYQGEPLIVSANGQFNFTTKGDDGSNFDVSLVNQTATPNQICLPLNSIGSITGSDVIININCKDIIYVDTSAPQMGDGLSWSTAYNHLQDALADPSAGQIWVAAGVYYPDEGGTQIDNDPISTITLIDGVSVYGGFIGSETLRSQRDPGSNITVLSGDIDENDVNSDGNNIAETVVDIQGVNAYHVTNGANIDDKTVLDGFTITAGHASISGHFEGAGMYCGGSTEGPSLNQMQFIGNLAGNGPVSGRGGATFGCVQNVTLSSFLNNQADDSAGAVYTGAGGHLDQVLFEGNYALIQASSIISKNNEINIYNASFISNSTGQGVAGAIKIEADMLLETTLFKGNLGSDGGAISMEASANLELINVTLTGNNATANGGAIRSVSTGAINIVNSIIWNNQDTTGVGTASASINSLNGGVINSNSLIQGFGTSGIGNLDEDPLFVTASDPSAAPTSLGNARLTELSMAIDTGDNSIISSTTDLDGNTRIFNGFVDMGAYEYFDEEVFKDGFE
jgi:hypothetical protein